MNIKLQLWNILNNFFLMLRWEAAHIPKVKVAKRDQSKPSKEQSVYMPQIPDIPQCPEHLMPLKEWEDSFLADFSKLRQVCFLDTNLLLLFLYVDCI